MLWLSWSGESACTSWEAGLVSRFEELWWWFGGGLVAVYGGLVEFWGGLGCFNGPLM